ncbi:cyclin-T2a isoform X2 [Hoplias malabaricus]|uniref:cyclin-T2a isoform X2 n=1 Tax=Hoplias malabaricus TaxID=27720 RepID=UPI003462BFEF
MAASRGSSRRWFFTREQLEMTPSRRCGVASDRELSYRQQAANLIQDMGQRLNVSQLTINTAIVYMHRFYMYHSFTKFHRNIISPTTLFLAAKVEEQPRKLEHVIKVAHACLNPQEPQLDTKSNAYLQQAQELVILETIVLQTLGFDITIEHPHTDVVKCSQLVRDKDLAQTSYFMATNSLHLTTFCLQYKPTVIACVCIHLVCKWSSRKIPDSSDGKPWWEYVDSSVTLDLLNELTLEFVKILEKTPSRLKKIRDWRATQAAKKPKADGQSVECSSFAVSSLTHNQSMVDAIPGVSSNAAFPKASTSFPVSLPGNSAGALSLDSVTNMQGPSFTFTAPSDWSQDQGRSDSFSLKQPPVHSSPAGQSHRPEKSLEFTPIKPEHKASSSGKQQPPVYLPLVPQTHKMSLEKYKEKHAAELAAQKHRHEQQLQQQSIEVEAKDSHTGCQAEHRKHTQPHPQGSSSGMLSTTSPLKMKLPLPAQDKPQGDKRDKGSSLKLRLPVPSQTAEKGAASKEELKMKIKVSSERHSSSDEGGGKSKHSSPAVSKEKHRDHSANRHHHHHHHKHGNSHASKSRSPVASLVGDLTSSSSARKRTHTEPSHNHHSSKKSKTSKSSAGSSSHCSSVQQCVSSHSSVLNLPFPPPPSPPTPVTQQVGFGHLSTLVKLDQKLVESHGPEGTSRAPSANGIHMDYRESFDMLDSLLSAQGMNL